MSRARSFGPATPSFTADDYGFERISFYRHGMEEISGDRSTTLLSKGAPSGQFRNHYAPTGLVEISGIGLWSVDYVDEHFAALERGLSEVRSKFGRARVLVNLSKAPVQSPATAERIAYWTDRIYLDVDRVAVLVDSIQLQKQMKTKVMIAVFDVFISEVAARLWLFQS